MVKNALVAAFGLGLAAATLMAAAGQQPVYRTSTTSVSVDVAVRQDGRPLLDLQIDDFELDDAGVRQRIAAASRETLPVDVTCVVDLSGSVQGAVLDALSRAVNAVGQRLRPTDRARVLTFNQQIRQVRPLQPGGWPEGLALGAPASLTSLFDALTLALITPQDAGRRPMTILFTDGHDRSSFLDGAGLVDLARRSSTAVFTVALADGTARRPARAAHAALFGALAEATGGLFTVLQRDEDLSGSFVRAFEDFRTSYVLTYTYEGPEVAGWHPLTVRVRRPGALEVRARQGYFGGTTP